jgi:hypothetical protein
MPRNKSFEGKTRIIAQEEGREAVVSFLDKRDYRSG